MATAFEKKPLTVVVVGSENLPDSPPLLNASRDRFHRDLLESSSPEERDRLIVKTEPASSSWGNPKWRQAALHAGLADSVVIVPPDTKTVVLKGDAARLPVAYNGADEKSQTCNALVRAVLAEWKDHIVQGRLERDQKPASYIEPVKVERQDIATRDEISGNIWAKLFPFLLVMMALTGAYYPAIDICAGEKERGTMETLLISPASREEIVLGKFFTVVLASVVTALLNLLSLGLTGWQIVRQFGTIQPAGPSGKSLDAVFGAPNLEATVWIVALLIPLSVFLGALSVALAVLARSMKEGQYYLTPLFLFVMPLTMITLMPGLELNLFTSLVPITGVALLLRTLMQGKYYMAAQFSLPVLVPTILYGVFALRWAVEQFQNEAVLFRESERFSVRDYLRHLIRDRRPRPNAAMAILCFALMLTSAWFLSPYLGANPTSLILGQAIFILGPPLVMTFLLTSDPLGTLRLRRFCAIDVALAALLAMAIHPLTSELRPVVERLFPVPEAIKAILTKLTSALPNLGAAVFALAVVPAVCEEFAFRGFILSGLMRRNRKVSAIVLSALLFGFLHVLLSLFQQLFNATLLGLILGLIAVKTDSLWPCIVFHASNNALAVLGGTILADPRWKSLAASLYRSPKTGQPQGTFQWHWIVLGAIVTAALLVELARRSDPKEVGVEVA